MVEDSHTQHKNITPLVTRNISDCMHISDCSAALLCVRSHILSYHNCLNFGLLVLLLHMQFDT